MGKAALSPPGSPPEPAGGCGRIPAEEKGAAGERGGKADAGGPSRLPRFVVLSVEEGRAAECPRAARPRRVSSSPSRGERTGSGPPRPASPPPHRAVLAPLADSARPRWGGGARQGPVRVVLLGFAFAPHVLSDADPALLPSTAVQPPRAQHVSLLLLLLLRPPPAAAANASNGNPGRRSSGSLRPSHPPGNTPAPTSDKHLYRALNHSPLRKTRPVSWVPAVNYPPSPSLPSSRLSQTVPSQRPMRGPSWTPATTQTPVAPGGPHGAVCRASSAAASSATREQDGGV
ncbi:hypothetical protein C8Q80DRAFT_1351759 [Daedaleopsis nitida]|nr:hypothetical protein C8Q80DRAFT_1351759 [Daedaleopsis nitida]